jgi:hypothetical protein
MLAIIVLLTIVPVIILLVGFFEIRLPFIKVPSEIIFDHPYIGKGKTKKIKKYYRRKTLINQSHIGFIKLSS